MPRLPVVRSNTARRTSAGGSRTRSFKKARKPTLRQPRKIRAVQLVVHGRVQIISHLAGVVKNAHPEVEFNARNGPIDSDLAQRFRFDHDRVTRAVSARSLEHSGGNCERGRREWVIAGRFVQRLRSHELLQVFLRSIFPGIAHIVPAAESEDDVGTSRLYQNCVISRFGGCLYCNLIMRCGIERANCAGTHMKATCRIPLPIPSLWVDSAKVEDAPGNLVAMLRSLVDFEFIRRQIPDRQIVAVARDNVDHGFVGLDVQHHPRVGCPA